MEPGCYAVCVEPCPPAFDSGEVELGFISLSDGLERASHPYPLPGFLASLMCRVSPRTDFSKTDGLGPCPLLLLLQRAWTVVLSIKQR